MQKVFSINLAGSVYQINEDAYNILNEYFDKCNNQISTAENSVQLKEIEIAEKIKFHLKNSNTIVDRNTVHDVLSTMINPSDFDNTTNNKTGSYSSEAVFIKKKLYRCTENRILGGVCAGFAVYFSIERWILRALLLFLVLSSTFNIFYVSEILNHILNGSSSLIILAYIVLWIAIPRAKHATQKNQTNNQEFNISTLESIQESYSTTNTNYQKPLSANVNNNYSQKNQNNIFSTMIDFFAEILTVLIRFFSKITGFFLLIFSIIFFTTLLICSYSIDPYWYLIFDDYQSYSNNKIAFWIFSGLIFGGILAISSILLRRRVKLNTTIGVILFIIWITSAIYLIFTGFNISNNFKTPAISTQNINFNPKGEVLNILSSNSYWQMNSFNFGSNNGFSFGKFAILDSGIYSGRVYVQIQPTDTLFPKLSFEISSYGKNKITATANQKIVSYNLSQSNDDLILSPFFKLPPQSKWSGQKVTLLLLLPLGYKIRFNEDAISQLNISEPLNNQNIEYLIGITYQMTKSGLIISN